MGYTTNFDGRFNLDKPLTVPQFNILNGLSDSENWRTDNSLPHSWCQWKATADGEGIEWDGGEKFYLYVEWLEHVIAKYIQPWGLALNGDVHWMGEEIGDVGIISVKDNVVTAKKMDMNGVAAKETALREAHGVLTMLDSNGGLGHSMHKLVRAVIALIETAQAT